MRVDRASQLSAGVTEAVAGLAEAAARADGVAPLSEHVLLHVRAGGDAAHFLAYDGTRLIGYAHLDAGSAGEPATAELVVAPGRRREGVGTALVAALEEAVDRTPAGLRLWSHGHLDTARAFAARDGYGSVRELWQMRRSLRAGADPLPPVSLPDGFHARTFLPGEDEQAWLHVNAAAFARHPEQGRMTMADLLQREAEPWFDPAGFILVEDRRRAPHHLAAFHWTKVHEHAASGETPVPHGALGEVYVVGVDPTYQGIGLGRAVTVLGLTHLRDRGLTEAMLYVDGDNTAAVATYTRLGFERSAVDVMYSPVVHPVVSR